MNEKGRASIDIMLQQPHAFVSRFPALDYDIVEFIAKKFIDDVLVLAIHFKKVGERACGGERASQRILPKQLLHRVG